MYFQPVMSCDHLGTEIQEMHHMGINVMTNSYKKAIHIFKIILNGAQFKS